MSQVPSPDNWFGIRTVYEIIAGGVAILWAGFKVQATARDAHTKIKSLEHTTDIRIRDIRQDMVDALSARDRQRAEDQERQDKRLAAIDTKLDIITNHLINNNGSRHG